MTTLKIVALWAIQALMALVMVGPGVQKFTSPVWQRMFRVWGYPDHFYLVIGAIEVVAGLGLLVPRIATPSALVLMCVMVGRRSRAASTAAARSASWCSLRCSG